MPFLGVGLGASQGCTIPAPGLGRLRAFLVHHALDILQVREQQPRGLRESMLGFIELWYVYGQTISGQTIF